MKQHTVSSGMEVTFKGGVADLALRCATCFVLSMTWYNLENIFVFVFTH